MKRREYIDALRGLAIIFMAVNHAGHYLAASYMPAWAYLLIYLTVTFAPPLFLFLAGASLVLSIKKEKENASQSETLLFLKYFRRGLELIALGWLINLFFYYDEPLWRGRILQTIGLSLILAYPFYSLTLDRLKRFWLSAIVLLGLMIYPFIFPALQALSLSHRIFAEIFMSEFPIYPWFFLALIGMIAGQEIIARGELVRKIRIRVLSAGAFLISSWLVLSIILRGSNIFSFDNDFNLNGYWNPSPLTWLWILGWLAILSLVFYSLANNSLRNMLRNNCLAIMGRKALFLYFLQFFLIITIGHTLLGLSISSFFWYVPVVLLIIYLLCLSAKSSKFASSTVFGRLRPKARIS